MQRVEGMVFFDWEEWDKKSNQNWGFQIVFVFNDFLLGKEFFTSGFWFGERCDSPFLTKVWFQTGVVDDIAGYSKDSFDWRTQLNSTNQLNTNLQPQEPQEPQTPVPSPPSRNQPPTFLEFFSHFGSWFLSSKIEGKCKKSFAKQWHRHPKICSKSWRICSVWDPSKACFLGCVFESKWVVEEGCFYRFFGVGWDWPCFQIVL